MLDLFLLLLLDAVVKFLVLLDFFLKRVFKATVLALFGSLLVIAFRVAHFLHGLHFCSLFALHLAQRVHCCLSSMLLDLSVSLFFFRFLTGWTEICLCLELCYGRASRCHFALHFDQLDFLRGLLLIELFLLSGLFSSFNFTAGRGGIWRLSATL